MTRAPASANLLVQKGAATACSRAMTNNPSKGLPIFVLLTMDDGFNWVAGWVNKK
jgi:hypothetical protein